jgi:hypothetical protein
MKNNYRQPAQTAEVSIPSTYDFQIQAFADLVNVPEARDEGLRILKDEYFTDEEILAGVAKVRQMAERGDNIDYISICPEIGERLSKQILDLYSGNVSMREAIGHYNALAKQSRTRAICVTCQELTKVVSESKDDAKETELFSRLDDLKKQPGPFWESALFDYSAEVIQPEPLLLCCGAPIATIENLTVISGKPKVCKTTLQSAIIAACLAGRSIMNIEPTSPFFKILLCDTEQSPYYLSKQCERIFRMAGIEKTSEGECALMVLNLRPYNPQERIAFIKKAVEDYKPDLLFIDGSADLVEDTNDLQSSERLVADLLTLSSKYNLGIITIVHSNPGGEGKVRGHLGSCLERKAETVITLERDGMSDRIKVKPRQTRNKPFEAFIITLDDQGDPELVSQDESPRTAEDWLLYLLEPGKKYRNRDLVEMVVNKGYGRTTVQHAITSALQHGRINKKGDFYMIELTGNVEDIPDG